MYKRQAQQKLVPAPGVRAPAPHVQAIAAQAKAEQRITRGPQNRTQHSRSHARVGRWVTCSSCGTVYQAPGLVVQRMDSDSDYSPSDEECDDTKYHTDDCELKPPYNKNVRSHFYPSGYWKKTMTWKASQVAALKDGCATGQFKCPNCAKCRANTDATIEHVTKVVDHWNTKGYNQAKVQRTAWYNDTKNHKVFCSKCNSSGGGKTKKTYRTDVGPDFDH